MNKTPVKTLFALVIVMMLSLVATDGCAPTTTISDSLTQQIDDLFLEWNSPTVPGGSVLVIRNGKMLYKKSFGVANLEEHLLNTPQTNFRLASVTKQFTAMAVMILFERKQLSFDNTLVDFFPDFPSYGKNITVRHLLQHTSGLIDYEDVMPDTTTIPLLDADVLTLMKKQDSTYFQPGTQYRYSNSGYALLALIVQKASGKRFADFLKENIFNPLGMTETLAYEKEISTVSNRAYGYSRRDSSNGNSFVQTDQSLTSSVLGDGGIYSSVEDLFQWDQALYTTKLVSQETLQEAWTPNVLPNGENSQYGFGWRIINHRGMLCYHHSGSTIGFSTKIVRFPEQKFTVIILTNRNNNEPEPLAFKIAGLFLGF